MPQCRPQRHPRRLHQTFILTNIQPQTPDNNQGIWASFETYCRSLTNTTGREVLLLSGGYGSQGTIGTNVVTVPSYNWKIAVLVPAGSGSPRHPHQCKPRRHPRHRPPRAEYRRHPQHAVDHLHHQRPRLSAHLVPT